MKIICVVLLAFAASVSCAGRIPARPLDAEDSLRMNDDDEPPIIVNRVAEGLDVRLLDVASGEVVLVTLPVREAPMTAEVSRFDDETLLMRFDDGGEARYFDLDGAGARELDSGDDLVAHADRLRAWIRVAVR